MKQTFYAGIDVGTSYIKAVILDETTTIKGFAIQKTGSDMVTSIKTVFDDSINKAQIKKNAIKNITTTGFGRDNVTFADQSITEISAHARGAYHYFPKEITVIDIGGQDTKIIKSTTKEN